MGSRRGNGCAQTWTPWGVEEAKTRLENTQNTWRGKKKNQSGAIKHKNLQHQQLRAQPVPVRGWLPNPPAPLCSLEPRSTAGTLNLFLQLGGSKAARGRDGHMVCGAARGAGLPPDPYSNPVSYRGQKIITRGNLTVAPTGKCVLYEVTEGPELGAG